MSPAPCCAVPGAHVIRRMHDGRGTTSASATPWPPRSRPAPGAVGAAAARSNVDNHVGETPLSTSSASSSVVTPQSPRRERTDLPATSTRPRGSTPAPAFPAPPPPTPQRRNAPPPPGAESRQHRPGQRRRGVYRRSNAVTVCAASTPGCHAGTARRQYQALHGWPFNSRAASAMAADSALPNITCSASHASRCTAIHPAHHRRVEAHFDQLRQRLRRQPRRHAPQHQPPHQQQPCAGVGQAGAAQCVVQPRQQRTRRASLVAPTRRRPHVALRCGHATVASTSEQAARRAGRCQAHPSRCRRNARARRSSGRCARWPSGSRAPTARRCRCPRSAHVPPPDRPDKPPPACRHAGATGPRSAAGCAEPTITAVTGAPAGR